MIKQNKELRYKRQELYNIAEKKLIPFSVKDKTYLVYGNVNLSIFVSDKCNGNCDFCVAQLRYFHEGVDYTKPVISNNKEYFSRLELMLKTVKPLNPSVSLTGGEPTLDPKLPRILSILDDYGVRKRTITTNGSRLLVNVEGTKDIILKRLIEYNLQHLNISRAHYDEERNQQIMKLDNPGFPNSELEKVAAIAKDNKIRPRLSCVLLKGEIDSVQEMVNYMDWAESIGVDNVVFRQLMKFDETSVKQGRIPSFCKGSGIDLIPIWEELDKDSRFSFIHQLLGYYYYVEVFKYKNIDMVSEMADLRLIEKDKELNKKRIGNIPVVHELVFHPNGNLCSSWREWKDVILE